MPGPVYGRILDVVRQVPQGQVATYGQIAMIAGDCTPRMVGYCLAALDPVSDVPWQRVINYKGMVSPRSNGITSKSTPNWHDRAFRNTSDSEALDILPAQLGKHMRVPGDGAWQKPRTQGSPTSSASLACCIAPIRWAG